MKYSICLYLVKYLIFMKYFSEPSYKTKGYESYYFFQCDKNKVVA